MEDYEVRGYQLEGALFLVSRQVALLADEPGVGKTFQAIAAVEVAQCRRVLVLCPTIARFHWLRQFEEYASTERKYSILLESNNVRRSTGGIICSYDLAIRKNVRTCLLSERWDVVICDEAHALSNPESQRSCLVWGDLAQRTHRIWCLSGTPARNNISELWPVLNAAGLWAKGKQAFIDEFCTVKWTLYGDKITGTKPEKVKDVKRLLEPVMLRRYVEDVMHELPAITHSMYQIEAAPVDLQQWYSKITVGVQTEEQLYDEIAAETRATEALVNLLKDTPSDAAIALGSLQNSTTQSRRYTGLSKVPPVVEIIKHELLSNQYPKIVLFAWHRDVIEFLRLSLAEFSPAVLHGGQLMTAKDTHIRKFQQHPAVRVCIAQIAAAGVAIDLTAASEVGFVEESYVPADNAQAVMRVHRFPQKRPVRCRYFCVANTIDEQVTLILRRKTADLTRILGKQVVPAQNPFA